MDREMGTPRKDAESLMEQTRATKSGRKVKRPAHFDDSPETKKVGSVSSMRALVQDTESPKIKPQAELAKKSARKTILKSCDDTPSKNGVSEPEALKKSARKTLLVEEQEAVKKSARKTIIKQAEATPTKEKAPELEVNKKSAKKAVLKSAGKTVSVEQEEGTPRKKPEPEPKEEKTLVNQNVLAEAATLEAGMSRTGRKIKVPAHLKEFEEVVVASPKKEATEKFISRKSMTPMPKKAATDPIEETTVSKTPGRGKSLVFRAKEPRDEPEESKKIQAAPKTPGKGKPLGVSRKEAEVGSNEQIVPSKTPVRGKSLVTLTKVSSVDSDEEQASSKIAKTPGKGKLLSVSLVNLDREQEKASSPVQSKRVIKIQPTAKREDDNKVNSPKVREAETAFKNTPKKTEAIAQETDKMKRGKSLALDSSQSSSREELSAKTPKRGKSIATGVRAASPDKSTDNLNEPISRSGRKIKPKKFFGEFEEEEPVSIVAKPASPVKSVSKVLPLAKSDSSHKQKVLSPVKRLSLPVQEQTKTDASPPKKMKLDLPAKVSPKVSKISPNTEERQITIRGSNDHHHAMNKDSDKDPLDDSSKQKSITVPSNSVSLSKLTLESSKNPNSTSEEISPKKESESDQKSKRGRKTLAVTESQTPSTKAPKTPSRRMTTAAVPVASISTEEAPINSRSGRKIKPKKFFGEDETSVSASASKTKSAVKPEGGRGRRKTLAADFGSDSQEKTNEDQEANLINPKKDEAKMEKLSSSEENAEAPGPGSESAIASDTQVEEKSAAISEDGQNQPQQQQQQPSGSHSLPSIGDDEQEQLDREDIFDSVEAALEENFQDTRIEQTSPAPQQKTKVPPNDPAPLAEHDLVPQLADSSCPTVELDAEPPNEVLAADEELGVTPEDFLAVTQPHGDNEGDHLAADPQENVETVKENIPYVEQQMPEQLIETKSDGGKPQEDLATLSTEITVDELVHNAPTVTQNPEMSASSSFSEALKVDEDLMENVHNSRDEHFECLEFLESSTEGAAVMLETEQLISQVPMSSNGSFNTTHVIDNDLDDVALYDQSIKEPTDNPEKTPAESANTSVTPEIEDDLTETKPPDMTDIDLDDEENAAEPANCTFTENDRDNESIIVIPETPMVAKLESSPLPASPKTPKSKIAMSEEKFSPDKPDDQHQPSVPQVIEIFDSPIPTALSTQTVEAIAGGSTTSTPNATEMPPKLTAAECIIQNSRKRSLSASDAEISKKNVTFHSPANSTILVDAIDERLKKSVNTAGSNQRKRSLSEHRDVAASDGVKPAKVTKLPNFKSIHQQQFKRMESIEEFHNRKVQRAKVLASSGSKSPAAAALAKTDANTPHKSTAVPSKSPFKAGNGTTSTGSKSFLARPKIGSMKPLSDTARVEKRQQQFQAAFKPKVIGSGPSGGSSKSSNDTPDGTRRVIEQSRHKQSQILKGVRTNKRFELLMKFRDTQE
ncbi:uncharacterized protein LOC128745432 [Sabethes cyaneus]|uniref:uncharacterized protein LOC128745432 n=1 Tax=Sabethes cyaneus TaxID=53552 RepID=UPI00237E8204|nr:uncharacterized protein LOC128745432 [Sabethes cyaneus]